MPEPTNADRAEWARIGVNAYAEETRYGLQEQTVSAEDTDHAEEVMSDLLCDMRHLCDVLGVSFHVILGRSLRDYEQDKAEERARANTRLEYLRGELEAERISGGELVELQSLAPYIEEWDVQLLEAAGVPEHEEQQ